MPPTLSVHDSLVTLTARAMQQNSMSDIKAAHIAGYAQPDQLGNYIPDVTGSWRGMLCIAECESRAGLAQAHTEAQWRTFYNHAAHVRGYFIAVVAKADETEAQALLQSIAGSAQNAQVWTF